MPVNYQTTLEIAYVELFGSKEVVDAWLDESNEEEFDLVTQTAIDASARAWTLQYQDKQPESIIPVVALINGMVDTTLTEGEWLQAKALLDKMLPGNENFWREYLLPENVKIESGVDLSRQQTNAAERALILMLP